MSNFPEGLGFKEQKREVVVEITVTIAVEGPGAGDRLMNITVELFWQ